MNNQKHEHALGYAACALLANLAVAVTTAGMLVFLYSLLSQSRALQTQLLVFGAQ